MSSIAECLRRAATRLAGGEGRIDAEVLLAHALGRSRSWLYAHADESLSVEHGERFEALLMRRERGEPIAQIRGEREFWSMPLVITADTLIPRPETELLVELALARMPRETPLRVLDLGTGSGAIALAISRERPRAVVCAVDASIAALAVAQKNAAKLGFGQVRFLRGDWFSPVRDERFDVIISNPPYLAEDDPHLHQGDLRFEPHNALTAGHDGLEDIRRIAAEAPAHLAPGGWLLVEHGWTQGDAVRRLFIEAGLSVVETAKDLEARDRVTLAQRA